MLTTVWHKFDCKITFVMPSYAKVRFNISIRLCIRTMTLKTKLEDYKLLEYITPQPKIPTRNWFQILFKLIGFVLRTILQILKKRIQSHRGTAPLKLILRLNRLPFSTYFLWRISQLEMVNRLKFQFLLVNWAAAKTLIST